MSKNISQSKYLLKVKKNETMNIIDKLNSVQAKRLEDLSF